MNANAQHVADHLRAAERERLGRSSRQMLRPLVVFMQMTSADQPTWGSLSKAEYLGATASGAIDYLMWETGAIEVKLYGDAAVIRYQAEVRIKLKTKPDGPSGLSGIQRCTRSELYFRRA